jgi:hypothetical protein
VTRERDLEEALEQFISSSGLEEQLGTLRVINAWPDIVGDQLSRVSNPQRLVDGVLHVRVRSGVWAQQLSLQQQELLKRYRQCFGRGTVESINFTVGSLSETSTSAQPNRQSAAAASPESSSEDSPSPPDTLDAIDDKWLEQRREEADCIADPELKKRFRQWLRAMHKRRLRALAQDGQFCDECGAPVSEDYEVDGLCPSCRLELQAGSRQELRELWLEMPWLKPSQVLELITGVDMEIVQAVRDKLLRELKEELRPRIARLLAGLVESKEESIRLKELLATAAMLGSHVRPKQLTRQTLFEQLGPQAAEAWGRLCSEEQE